MEEKRKLSGKEKFAYGIGAVGKDMVYMLSASYILYYYQDIMGISAWIMGIILLVARVFDAFNDPIMGILVAKTKTKWGKFRPWLFIGTLTNAIVLYFMFACPPSLDGAGLVAYAAVFYIIWGVTYTMMDIPYWSMVPAFTEGGKERENLSALARTCAGVGSALITIITVISVSAIGSAAAGNSEAVSFSTANGNNLKAYVVEVDERKAETGNVLELDSNKASIDIALTASDEEKEGAVSYSEGNTNYSVKINSLEYTNDNSKMCYVMDSVASGEGSLVIRVSQEDFGKIVTSESNTVSAEISSKKQVERLGFKYFSLIIAVLFFAFILITCACIKEKSTVDVKSASVGEMFKALIQNDQAMAVVIAIVLVNSAVYITSNLLIYFFKYDLGGANWEGNYTLFSSFGGGMQILAMMLIFPLLRKFFNTIKIFYICIISAISGYFILLFIALSGNSQVLTFFVPGFFIFSAVGILNVIVTVFLANTVDYGELKNNRRDESVIFSMQTFVVKLASGVAALVASICLSVFSISESSNVIEAVDGSYLKGLSNTLATIEANGASLVSGSSVFGLRMTMTIIPVVVLFLALLIFKKKYILTDEKLREITDELKSRR